MDCKTWGELLVNIEQMRRKLHDIYNREPNNTDKLIKASKKLDKLINKHLIYQRSKEASIPQPAPIRSSGGCKYGG